MTKSNKCPECNHNNGVNAKFCSHCGSELAGSNYNICRNCQAENSEDAKFCFKCGSSLSQIKRRNKVQRKPKHNTQNKKNNSAFPGKPIFIAAAILAAVFLYIIATDTNSVNSNSLRTLIEQKSNDKVLEATVLDVAAKFICSCGTCNKQSLDICTCDVAITERQFIRNALQNKQKPDDVIVAVNQKYGWIKEQYKEKYGAGKFVLENEPTLKLTPGIDLTKSATDEIASIKDRMAIISSFACTCGQCAIDELKDCNCNHPGGATEVKNFIDQKISEGRYSKENIIQIVEGKYGKRIR